MNNANLAANFAQLTPDDIALLVSSRAAAGNRVIDGLIYFENGDLFLIYSGRLALLIERKFIDELRDISSGELKQVEVSKSGTSIFLDTYDIHIEAAGLMVDYINHLKKTKTGGSIMDLLQGSEIR